MLPRPDQLVLTSAQVSVVANGFDSPRRLHGSIQVSDLFGLCVTCGVRRHQAGILTKLSQLTHGAERGTCCRYPLRVA
jgi:hypothetical protein